MSVNRWRLILGKYSEESLGGELDKKNAEMSNVLDYLYGKTYDENDTIRKSGGRGQSSLTVPKWLRDVKKLFPKETVEIIEKHALEKYKLKELLNDKNFLESLEPNDELLKTILEMKNLMSGDVLQAANDIVKKIAEKIKKELESHVRFHIVGKLDKQKRGQIKTLKNLNVKKTLMQNLKNYNKDLEQIIIERPYFNSSIKNYNKWNIIIAVDESGSMVDSVIYSAIMASIFAEINALTTKLLIFDTAVVDLSDHMDDIVKTLMSVQLGGGTNIGKALRYSEQFISNPQKTIVILVTDLYDGFNLNVLYKATKDIVESGAKLLVLPALNKEGIGVYDKNVAKNMAAIGAEVAAVTPEGLSKWIAEIIH